MANTPRRVLQEEVEPEVKAEVKAEVKTDQELAESQAPKGYSVQSILRVGTTLNATLVSDKNEHELKVITFEV